MRIQFDNTHSQNVDKVTTTYVSTPASRTEKTGAFALDISGTVMDNTAYEVQGRTAEEVMQAAGNQDVALLRNYMTVMSNSMSREDFARLQKEGGCPTDMDIETVVTIVDKIKAELAKAGVDIAGFTDTLDDETLAAIAGSEGFARAIADALKKADVPVTRQNVADTAAAAGKAQELKETSEGTAGYMVKNQMEPTVDNFYRAEYSGADHGQRRAGGYFQEELPGYYAKRADGMSADVPVEQIQKVIREAGYEVTQETMEDAGFLIEKGIPLTADSLRRLEQIRQAHVPPSEKEFLDAAAAAIAEGKPAGAADLYDGRSCYDKAVDLDQDIDRLLDEARISGNAASRRQLEEIRLMMTAEANVKLIKSGFAIDTSDLEELVEALKQLEQEQARQLFGAGNDPEADYSLYKETLQKTAELPYMPAAVAGKIASQGTIDVTVDSVYEQGKALQRSYEQAREDYEALMTAPRKDMGDSIKKAFRNVDAILEDMGMESTETNRRAVRILGYNSMEITEDNIMAVKQADRTLKRVVDKITPRAAVQMIRDGINPLKTGLEQLEQYLDGLETYDEEAVKYSRYLYNLEQNHEITPQEKESYIGIYRMLRQIEKTDGAVIGSLVNSVAELNFTNLLTAVRTGRSKGVNAKVDEAFGVLEQVNAKGLSVTEQIAMGYTSGLTDTWSGEIQEQGYDDRLLEEIRDIRQTEDSVIRLLQKYELPVSADNLLAMSHLSKDRGSSFRKLWQKREDMDTLPEAEEDTVQWEDMLTDRDNAVNTYEAYTDQLINEVKERTFSASDTSLDVRAMQLVHKQLHILQAAAQEEEYDIPVEIDGEMTAIHLTFRHDTEETGRVSVSLNGGHGAAIAARLELEGRQVRGYAAGEGADTRALLAGTLKHFSRALDVRGMEAAGISVIQSSALTEGRETDVGRTAYNPRTEAGKSGVETAELYQVAKLFIQAFRQNFKYGHTEG